MTGRDLIVYILTNHLENAEIRNGKLMVSGNDFMKDEQVASILVLEWLLLECGTRTIISKGLAGKMELFMFLKMK